MVFIVTITNLKMIQMTIGVIPGSCKLVPGYVGMATVYPRLPENGELDDLLIATHFFSTPLDYLSVG